MKAVLLLLFSFPLVIAGDAAWISLFDGATLSGWHVEARPEDRGKRFWSVRDGTITCDSLGRGDHNYVWLLTDAEYGDFELRLKVRGFPQSTGNTGVQVRSRYDHEAGWMDGPQVDIHPPAAWRAGLIYDETRGARRWISPSLEDWKIDESHARKGWKWHEDGWNTVRIECRGTRIRTWVNAAPITDYDGKGTLDDADHQLRRVGLKGHIALQLHNKDELLVQFKEIRLRPLD